MEVYSPVNKLCVCTVSSDNQILMYGINTMIDFMQRQTCTEDDNEYMEIEIYRFVYSFI